MKLYDLIKEGHLVQGVIALGSVAAIIYLAVVGQQVPEVLVATSSAIVGYYFRASAEASGERRMERMLKQG